MGKGLRGIRMISKKLSTTIQDLQDSRARRIQYSSNRETARILASNDEYDISKFSWIRSNNGEKKYEINIIKNSAKIEDVI